MRAFGHIRAGNPDSPPVREEMFYKSIVALIAVIKDEINLLRAQHSLPERTAEQVEAALESKIEQLYGA